MHSKDAAVLLLNLILVIGTQLVLDRQLVPECLKAETRVELKIIMLFLTIAATPQSGLPMMGTPSTDKYVQRTIPEIPNAYEVFEQMYAKVLPATQ